MLTSGISFQLSKWWMRNSVYTSRVGERGELLTHDKDQSVLTLMKLDEMVVSDFEILNPHWTLGQLIPIIERSSRNLFPVLDRHRHLLGVVDLQDVREVMFDQALYNKLKVHELMVLPEATVEATGKMEHVMRAFERTNAVFLPVVTKNGTLDLWRRPPCSMPTANGSKTPASSSVKHRGNPLPLRRILPDGWREARPAPSISWD